MEWKTRRKAAAVAAAAAAAAAATAGCLERARNAAGCQGIHLYYYVVTMRPTDERTNEHCLGRSEATHEFDVYLRQSDYFSCVMSCCTDLLICDQR